MEKILIITYYWPPAGGPGVQRWLKFVKYLPNWNYQPHVYIPENPSYPIIDKTLINEVNPEIKIIKHPIWEPYQIAEKLNSKNKDFKKGLFEKKEKQSLLSKLSIFIRGNFFIPDARIAWVKPSVKFLNQYLEDENINTIITTGPPHSIHLIGLNLKNKNPNLKWVADFRDPWTEISYHKELKLTHWASKKHLKLEKVVLSSANAIIATSYKDGENFRKIGAKKVEIITNGFEPNPSLKTETKTENFNITYSGGLEQLRNPSVTWKAIEELTQENPLFSKYLNLNFFGFLSNQVKEDIFNHGLQKHFVMHGYIDHQSALNAINDANILLLTNFNESKSRGIIPGKLFEYMATRNPILSIGPRDSDVELILHQTKSGSHFSYHDLVPIKNYIKLLFIKWLEHKNIKLTDNSNLLIAFQREYLTEKLVNLIQSL